MSKMVTKGVFALSFAFVGYFLQTMCWKRGENNRFFDGAVFFHRNFALETDILRKVITTGELECGFACLSENDCIAQTYCVGSWNTSKGTCYLHKNGIKGEQTVGVLARRDTCTFQQYIDFYEASCSRQCRNGQQCYYDHNNRRYACLCEPPFSGMYCEQVKAISYRFTTLGATGNSGPVSTAGYANTSLRGAVTLLRGIQIWTVPFTALFTITVAGSSARDTAMKLGGHGAIVTGVVRLTKGTVLHLLIGQKGLIKESSATGGGGGTFVVFSNDKLLAAAGGGGGAGVLITSEDGSNGQTYSNGTVYGGENGLGGHVCAGENNFAGGGGGFKGNGKCSYNISCTLPRECYQAGKSYLNGGLGGTGNGTGGFGGGGAAYNAFPGGGGGYSGGGVLVTSYGGSKGGGGGSFFTDGVKASNQVNTGDGYVSIDYDSSIN